MDVLQRIVELIKKFYKEDIRMCCWHARFSSFFCGPTQLFPGWSFRCNIFHLNCKVRYLKQSKDSGIGELCDPNTEGGDQKIEISQATEKISDDDLVHFFLLKTKDDRTSQLSHRRDK